VDLPEKAKRAPPAPVWNQSFPSPRWTCLKRGEGKLCSAQNLKMFPLH